MQLQKQLKAFQKAVELSSAAGWNDPLPHAFLGETLRKQAKVKSKGYRNKLPIFSYDCFFPFIFLALEFCMLFSFYLFKGSSLPHEERTGLRRRVVDREGHREGAERQSRKCISRKLEHDEEEWRVA
jgi:hypothetical protein